MVHQENSLVPLVSIGFPVFNGITHVRQAIESLLAQDYTKIELIISDNASTDGTYEVCESYARIDPRIRVFRNDINVGAAKNFNRVFSLSSGKYFMWAAHDDQWHSSYISKCIAELETHPKCVLCGSDIQFIDANGNITRREGGFNRLDTAAMSLRDRVRSLTAQSGWYAFYGLMRFESLKRTRLYPAVYGGDVVLLMEILLQGETRIVDQKLFTYRLIEKPSGQYVREITGSAGKIDGPFTQLARDLLDVIARSEIPHALKQEMSRDLFENVSCVNQDWLAILMSENPELRKVASYQVPVEIQSLLLPGMPPKAISALRENAYDESLSGLPKVIRIARQFKRHFEKYVGWRLRA